jgi:hypothetical protein
MGQSNLADPTDRLLRAINAATRPPLAAQSKVPQAEPLPAGPRAMTPVLPQIPSSCR